MKKQNIITIGILLLAFFFVKEIWGFTEPQLINVDKPNEATANKYYVDLDAGSNGDGSIGNPWNSLQNAKSGMTGKPRPAYLYMKGSETLSGEFAWNQGGNGTGQELVITAWGSETATITGYFRPASDWIIFDGKSFTSPQLIFDGSNVETAVQQTEGATDIIIWRCRIRNSNSVGIHVVDNIKIFNSVVHSHIRVAIYNSHGTNIEIRNNIIYGPSSVSAKGVQINPHDSGRVVKDIVVSGNAIYGFYEKAIATLSGIDPGGFLDGAKIYNNLVWDCNQAAIHFSSEVSGRIEDVQVYGNTLHGGVINDQSGTTTFRNNIITGSVNSSGFVAYSNNNQGASCLASTTSSSSDFLKLKSTASDCINKGATGLGLTSDYFGNSRDSVPDIGAHEYGGGTPPDTTPPAAPSGLRVR